MSLRAANWKVSSRKAGVRWPGKTSTASSLRLRQKRHYLPLGCRRERPIALLVFRPALLVHLHRVSAERVVKGNISQRQPDLVFLEAWGGEAAHRLDNYIKFESVVQFAPLIENAAQLVAAEVVALRAKFRTLADIHRFFAGNLSWNGNVYRAAITAGLIGDFALARQLFAQIKGLDPNRHGLHLKDRQAECAALAALLDDPRPIGLQFGKGSTSEGGRAAGRQTRNASKPCSWIAPKTAPARHPHSASGRS